MHDLQHAPGWAMRHTNTKREHVQHCNKESPRQVKALPSPARCEGAMSDRQGTGEPYAGLHCKHLTTPRAVVGKCSTASGNAWTARPIQG